MMRYKKLGYVAFNVSDLDRSVAFYRDTLGARFLFQAGTLGFFDLDGVRLMLAEPEGEGGTGGSGGSVCSRSYPTVAG